jgi:hypothetical protein
VELLTDRLVLREFRLDDEDAVHAHPDNTASAHVLRKAGMRFEGTMRGHRLVRGSWRDSLLFARPAGHAPRDV